MNIVDNQLIVKIVQLGNVIRRHRSEGTLQSVPPPTIYGYLALLRMTQALPHINIKQAALATLLGNASLEDRKHISGIFNEVFGLNETAEHDPAMGGNLF